MDLDTAVNKKYRHTLT